MMPWVWTLPWVWTYKHWTGRVVSLGGDEWFRRTIVLRLPFTTFAVVVAVSPPGRLYDPVEFPDPKFERWMRAFGGR
ncbi:hypothetical protein SEA_JALFARM20_47 [Mycobacterium phage JalFarm20]|uniref:Uncharacterized protein n=2 Tax=Avanivirus TaxID=2843352 RepID=A0A059VKS1_9CAUD|nr:hypothetical protein I5I04_gp050 [Mycobacterium phage Zapner]AHZ95504.1 hypothetical protein PBI_ZAPNER_50 [Mycobacterium phage Zapner]UEM46005.1 hypothetical protein SEA_JALFARM20_47 [Mycobacterium phage JalFarm20]